MTETIETGTEHLLAERAADGEVMILTLNRPERRNALSGEMLVGLTRALERCEEDASVRCIVLTGSGSAFCAGGDVKAMASDGGAGGAMADTFEASLAAQRRMQRATVARLYRMPKPVLAALPGAAAGAGLGLCMACDLRIAADSALMTTAFARVGLSGDFGLPWLLAQQVGRAKALELFYLSDKLNAQQCLDLGLVQRVVPAESLREATLELALRLAQGPSVAFGYIKENLNAAFDADLEEFMEGEVMRHLTGARTEDHREAVAAFVEGRAPKFQGR